MSKRNIVDELHKPARRNFTRRKTIVKGIDDLWQADLVEMGSYSNFNKGYRFLLTVIDTFSKYAWCKALKSKSSKEVSSALKSVFDMGRIPKNLQTDAGKEFFNVHFQNVMKKYKINHYATYSVLKAAIVERFNRTLKQMMWKEFSYHGTYRWIDNYKSIVEKYNNTPHRTIHMKPNEVNKTNEEEILKKSFNNLKMFHKAKFKVGDNVRISKYKHIFEKGYTPNWTTEIFRVKHIKNTNPATYILQDYEGNEVKGGFYELELMKTRYPDIYLVEKILKRKGEKVFVKWLGFTKKHNSWIKIKDVL